MNRISLNGRRFAWMVFVYIHGNYMKNEQQLPLMITLLMAVIIVFSEVSDLSFINCKLFSIIDSLCNKVFVRYQISNQQNIYHSISLITETLDNLSKQEVLIKGAFQADNPRAYIDSRVIDKNIANLILKYRVECLTWKDFDAIALSDYESIDLETLNVCPFRRQREGHSTLIMNEDKLEKVNSQDEKLQEIELMRNEVHSIKFPYLSTMCPQAEDKLEDIPIMKAIDIIHYLQQSLNFLTHPYNPLKKLMKLEDAYELDREIMSEISEGSKTIGKLIESNIKENSSIHWKNLKQGYNKEVQDCIIKFQQLLIAKLLLHEKQYYKEGNIIRLYKNEHFQKATLFLSAEIFFFAFNSTQISSGRIQKTLGVSYLNVWKIIKKFLCVFDTMPQPLVQHIKLLEGKILLYKIFSSSSMFAVSIYKRMLIPSKIIEVLLDYNFVEGNS